MLDTVEWAAPLLPADRPRYFMGIGDPEGVLEVIARGVDMFDCVLPTRTARTGSALTWEGRLNMRNARFARDPRPLDEDCPCPACRRFSRAYVRHLVNQQELLGLRLLSLHNLRFLLDVVAGARAAIERGELRAYVRGALDRLAGAREEACVAQLLILVFFGFLLMWVFVVLPQRRRMAAHERMVEEIKVGDEILTAGGLFGDVTEIGEDEVAVEIAPGVEVRVATRAIANVIPPDTYDDEDEGEAGEQAADEDGVKNTEPEATREPTRSDRR